MLTTLEQKAAPGNAALVVIDVQNDFVADGGFFDSIGADVRILQQRTVPALVRLLEQAHEAGVLVVYVQAIYDAPFRSAAMEERKLRLRNDRWPCISGTWGAEFYRVCPLPGDPVVVKHRYSGMIGTDLDAVLKTHGVKSLLLAGVATDTCVESTGRDAYFMDYYVSLISDCSGAFNESDHSSALKRFSRDYGLVVTSDELVTAWHRLGARASRAHPTIAQ